MAKNTKKTKGYSPRKVNTREIKQRFLIVCEGTKTELNYFKSFRVPTVPVNVQGLGRDPSKIVQYAKMLSEEDEYDQI